MGYAFNWLDYVLIVACCVLNIYAFSVIRSSTLRSFRYYMVVLLLQKVILFSTLHSMQWYFDLYWYSEMIALCWMAYLAGQVWQLAIPISNQLVTKIPCAVVIVVSLFYMPTTYRTNQMMLSYRGHVLSICFLTLLGAFVFATAKKHLPLAQAVLTATLAGLSVAALWLFGVKSTIAASAAELASVWLLIVAASKASRFAGIQQSES